MLAPQAVLRPVCSHSACFYIYVQISLDTRNLKGCSAPSVLQCNVAVRHEGKGIWEETTLLSGQARTVE